MTTKKKMNYKKRLLRIGSSVMLVLIFLIGFGVINQRLVLAQELDALAAPGQLIEVNGRMMHLHCSGEGSPSVIIDAGNADFSLSWQRVQTDLAQKTRVCTYDRAGYGWSDATDGVHDAAHVVADLHSLLQAEDSGPYLLVGHSLGGIHMQLYALTYGEEVAGLVLVDSPPVFADFIDSTEFQSALQANNGFYNGMRLAMSSGLPRLFGPLLGDEMQPEVVSALPEIGPTYLTQVQRPEYWQTALSEANNVSQSAAQVRAYFNDEQPFGDLPLIMLSAGDQPAEIAPMMVEGQTRQAQLSAKGSLRIIENSSHAMHLDAPAAIVQAVEDLIISN